MCLALLSALAIARERTPPERSELYSFETDTPGQILDVVLVQSGEHLRAIELRVRQPDGTTSTTIALQDGRAGESTTTRCAVSHQSDVDFWWLGFDGFPKAPPKAAITPARLDLTGSERLQIEMQAARRLAQAQLRDVSQQFEHPWWLTLERERRGTHIHLSVDADRDGIPEITRRVVLAWRPRPSRWVWRCAVRIGLTTEAR